MFPGSISTFLSPPYQGEFRGIKPIQVPLIKGDLGGSNQFKSPLSRGI
ncbi:hypothetical protein C789_2908 [Microcystis aeruginosa FACHB-905 = DIANCHI905]|nr:hypothetical protein C789_2908 [Microcystis aeruginosa FACHB-905 = DIANCHI905]